MASLNYKTEDGWKKVSGGKTGVLTFKGRAGVVTPKEGDYSAEMVGAISADDKAVPNGVATLGDDGKLLDAQIPELDKLGAAPAGYGGFGEKLIQIDSTSTESELNEKLSEVFATLKVGSSVQLELTPIARMGRGTGVLYKIDNSYGHLSIVGYGFRYLYKRFFGGVWEPWEWVNPPMYPDEEYRTTERYDGMPVYVKLVSIPSLTANVATAVEYSTDTNCRPISVVGGYCSGNAIQTGIFGAVSSGSVGTIYDMELGADINYIIARSTTTISDVAVIVKYYKKPN